MKFLFFLFFLKITYEADLIKIIPGQGTEIVVARGNIYLTDGKTVIKGDSAMIFKREEIDSGFISGNVNIEGENITISCNQAKYDFLREEAKFFENVEVRTPKEFIRADYVFYSSKKDFSFAKDNVIIEKNEEGLKIFCEEAYYNFKTKKGKVRKINKIEILSERNKILMYGDSINIFQDTLCLIGNVRIEGEKEKASGDTLLYFQKDEMAYLLGLPVFYFEKGSAKGKRIILKFEDKKIKEALLEDNSYLEILTEKQEKVIINTPFVNTFFNEYGEIYKLTGFDNVKGFILLNSMKENEGQDKD